VPVADSETYHRAPDAASAEVDGETVVLSPTDLRYHSLNVTAAAIWTSLTEPRTVDQVVADLLEEFEIDEATCRAEAESCLGHLVEIGVVVRP
jgi:hypothetical protein